MANFRVPNVDNEPNVRVRRSSPSPLLTELEKTYAKGSAERQGLMDAFNKFKSQGAVQVTPMVAGKAVSTTCNFVV